MMSVMVVVGKGHFNNTLVHSFYRAVVKNPVYSCDLYVQTGLLRKVNDLMLNANINIMKCSN